MYTVKLALKQLIYDKTGEDFGKYVIDWTPFTTCGVDDVFDACAISITNIETEPDSIIIMRVPTISYANILKFKISDIFKFEPANMMCVDNIGISTASTYQAETFFGHMDGYSADEAFNDWIKDHPNIHIEHFGYSQARYGEHSICILYKTNDNK